MGRRWTEEDLQVICELRGKVSISDVAERLSRSEYAVRSYLKRRNIPWGRWARRSLKREQIDLIRQRHVVIRAQTYFQKMIEFRAVISMVEIVRESGARATIRSGFVVRCPDQDLIDEAAVRVGYIASAKAGKDSKTLIYRLK